MTAGLMIAGTHSGVGKTTIAAGLTAALANRGHTVQPFKVGPDYIDPGYHAAAAGRACRNLDTWLIPPDRVAGLFARAMRTADTAVIEGVMGVFDGRDYEAEAGSSAEVAKRLNIPVVLVIDAAASARSAGAIALGYQQFDPDLRLAGFLVNRVGSASHGRGVSAAIERTTGLPVLGWIPRDGRAAVPERHLGLRPATETGSLQALTARLVDLVEQHVEVDRLLAIARDAAPPEGDASDRTEPDGSREPTRSTVAFSEPRPVLAVARDPAFHFMYEHNLELLAAAGADVRPFSPLNDAALPEHTAGVILCGGFPEMFAEQLATNAAMREALRRAHTAGLPIYAECGGLMYLTEAIREPRGREYPMVGLLPGRSRMTDRPTLGYREATAAGDSWLFRAGEAVRGHEFHYSLWEERPSDLPPAFRVEPRRASAGPRADGACLGNLWASYVHLHFAAMPSLAERFVAACRASTAAAGERKAGA